MLTFLLAFTALIAADATRDHTDPASKNSGAKYKRRAATLPVTRVAAISCSYQNDPQPGWPAIFRYLPDALIFGGDNVYGDIDNESYGPPTPQLKELAASYKNQSRNADFNKARYTVPYVYATWDDHDFGINDGGSFWPYKKEAQKQFNDFWEVPKNDSRRSRPGVYSSDIVANEFGTVQFIMLDTRYFRSNLTDVAEDQFDANFGPYVPNKPGEGTFLGAAQWKWLEEELKKKADVRIVMSSVQVIPTAHGWEKWGNMPSERKRLFDLIDSTGAGGVVFISGDRHAGALYSTKLGSEPEAVYPLYELTTSGLTEFYPGNMEPGPMRIGAPYGMQNFGAVDIDWLGRTITLSVRNNAGDVVRSVDVDMDEIKAGGPMVVEADGQNKGTGNGKCTLDECAT